DGEPPAADELRLGPTLDWLEASLPQQNAHQLAGMRRAVELQLDGLCERTLHIGGADVAAQIPSDSQAFVRWITQRGTWEALRVQAQGDPSALEITRQL